MHIISYNNPRRVQICSYLEAAASQTTMKLWMFDQATLQANDTPFATAHPFQKRWWWHYNLAFGQWHHKNLVGGIPTPLKNMKVRWDDEIPNFFMGSQLEVHGSSHHQPDFFSEASILILSDDQLVTATPFCQAADLIRRRWRRPHAAKKMPGQWP